jgi:threonine synthase
MEDIVKSLICNSCSKEYSIDDPVWKCSCEGLLDLKTDPIPIKKNIDTEKHGMWRYRKTIPIDQNKNIVSFQEGFTPLLEIETGEGRLYIKQDHLFPTGSYKDRGASVLISKVKELGIKKVVEDSSGNAGAAIAAYCAKAEIECDIYVPESTSAGKLAQIELYGANLHKVPGSRENTAEAVMEAAEKNYYASHSWNPWFFQGTKTFAYETCEQLGWKAPDIVILPAGNGTLFLGAYIGFLELMNAGIIDIIPKMIAVQTANCAPLYKSYINKLEEPSKIESITNTLAEGIAIAKPVRGTQILKAVRETNGELIAVTEDEIKYSLWSMMKQGYYIEPTSAAVIAGAVNYQKVNREAIMNKTLVTVFTGHGLKGTDKLLKLKVEN